MCDGFTLADLCFVIDGNLGNLYCYPRPAPINNCNLRVSFLGQKSPHKISIVNYLDTVWLGGVVENCYRHGAVMFDSISLCLKHGNKKRKQAVHMMMSGCAHLWIKLFITGIGIQPFLPGGKDSGGTIWYLVTKYRKNVESRVAPVWRARISASGLSVTRRHGVVAAYFSQGIAGFVVGIKNT